MAYAEFYVTNGSAVADTNGGSMNTGNGQTYTNDGPCVTKANCSSDVAGTSITNDDADGWGTAAANDYINFDSGEYAKITNVAGDVLTVTPAVTGSQAAKTVKVGGAWENPDVAVTSIDTLFSTFAAGTPPRLNIQGNQTLTGTITPTAAYTALIPLIIQGYSSTPGDAPSTQPILDYGGGKVIFHNPSNFVFYADLHFKKTQSSGTAAIDINGKMSGFLRCVMEATAGAGNVVYYPQQTPFIGCDIKITGTATGPLVYASYNDNTFIGCIFRDGDVSNSRATFVHCRFLAAYADSAQKGCAFVNTLFEPPAAKDAIKIDNALPGVVTVINSIIQDVNASYSGIDSDDAGYSSLFDLYNCYYNNTTDRHANIANYLDGAGEVSTDPDLDANDRPQANSPVIGTGYPSYADIGALSALDGMEFGGEIHLLKALVYNKRTQVVATGVITVYEDDDTTPLLTLTPAVSTAGGTFTITKTTPNSPTPGVPATELHYVKAYLCNKKVKNQATGGQTIYEDDDATPSFTLSDSTASGVRTIDN